jgi:dihydropteroate synthase
MGVEVLTSKKLVASPRSVRGASSVRIGTCNLRLNVPRIMGIVNNTPDSFSGDGTQGDAQAAIKRGITMFQQGADIVDVGGESTRPNAMPVPVEVELARTISVVEALSELHPGRVSIDTMKPEVAEAGLFAGASVVNDVSGLRNRRMIEIVAEHDASVIIMHMQGEPRTMQVSPRYRNVIGDIKEYLAQRVAEAERAGIGARKIMVDPGIGFGKTLDHNLEIISRLREFKTLGKPLVIGLSRKAFIGKITGAPAGERTTGSVVAAVIAVRNGADIVRVHDVAETRQGLDIAAALESRT